ncbi:MAG: hypothetical protein PWR03_2131 [Tenuifilum sp.]|jgi:hypothetical protein|nr:hypothetical protein [Tenuifilum sp.]
MKIDKTKKQGFHPVKHFNLKTKTIKYLSTWLMLIP